MDLLLFCSPGSGRKRKKIDQNLQKNLNSSLQNGFCFYLRSVGMFNGLLLTLKILLVVNIRLIVTAKSDQDLNTNGSALFTA
jgi:hypothetical protein